MVLNLVTGASGFVGRALTQRLLDRGERVRAVVAPDDPGAIDLQRIGNDRLEVVVADVTDRDAVDAACEDIGRVYHSAAMVHAWAPIEAYRRVNVNGTRNVAEAAFLRGIDRFVHVSTSDVFGLPQDDRPIDESFPFREWGEPYPDSKIEAELWLWRFHRERGLPVSVVYPGWVYGPGDRAFFPALASAIRDGSMTFWHPNLWLPWAYIDNLIDACVLIADREDTLGQGYLVFDGDDGPTLQEICGRIAEKIGCKPPTRTIPRPLARLAAKASQFVARGEPLLRTADVKAFGYTWRFSNAKLTALGWAPRIAHVEGFERAIAALAD